MDGNGHTIEVAPAIAGVGQTRYGRGRAPGPELRRCLRTILAAADDESRPGNLPLDVPDP